MERVKLKVCGMRDAENITEIASLQPDYLGFIFYEKSPRYAGNALDAEALKQLPQSIQKVGVFVNESVDKVKSIVKAFQLDFVQLHGGESPEECEQLKEGGIGVIKVFSVGGAFDFQVLEAYKPFVDYFLFDTKGKAYGGNGTTFDWRLLSGYDNEIPFFLSGGIGMEHIEEVKKLKQLNIHALDVNSKFEQSPGVKDYNMLKDFKRSFYQNTTVNS